MGPEVTDYKAAGWCCVPRGEERLCAADKTISNPTTMTVVFIRDLLFFADDRYGDLYIDLWM
jgi:hypothetical protein